MTADSTDWYVRVTGWPPPGQRPVSFSAPEPSFSMALTGPAFSTGVPAGATVLDFEELPTGKRTMTSRNPYHGAIFSSETEVTCPTIYHWNDVAYGRPHSGTRFIYNGCGGGNEYVRFAEPVVFHGAWIGNPEFGATKYFWFEGYRNGVKVGQTANRQIVAKAAMVWVAADFPERVDQVYFRRNYGWWVADDITFDPRPEATDVTPPVITPNITGTLGSDGWYTSDVTVTWTVADDESPATVTAGCEAGSVVADTPGVTFTCAASSAGGSDGVTISIKRDATPPAVTFAGQTVYSVEQTVSISCTVSDAMSGVASHDCSATNSPAWAFEAGFNSVSAQASDRAGNTTSQTFGFIVSVNEASLCTLVRAWATTQLANSLCAKLANAEAAGKRGQENARANMINAFVNEVKAQTGKGIPADHAAVLTRLARDL